MLIGCITGPDFETAKRQIAKANLYCDGVELRLDHLSCDTSQLARLSNGIVFKTGSDLKMHSKELKVSTYHNFTHTPEDLDRILSDMPEGDIYKIATWANSTLDALRMLSFVQKNQNIAGICMGPFGAITRVLAPVVGSRLNFTPLDIPTAPGQIPIDELVDVYDLPSLNQETKIYGLIGHPLDKSPGHLFHNAKFRKEGINAVYVKIELQEHELSNFFALIKTLPFEGFSVTMPLKKKVLDFLDAIDEGAREMSAVNTIYHSDGWKGTNTDGIGGVHALGQEIVGKEIAILGIGGAGSAIGYEAKRRGANVKFYSRRLGNLDETIDAQIVINTTPVVDPINPSQLTNLQTYMDITFRLEKGAIEEFARKKGCMVVGSEEMYQLQAKGQWLKWGHTPSW